MQENPITSFDPDAAADYVAAMLLWLDRSVSERELHKNGKKWRRDVSSSPLYHALSLMKVGLLGFDDVAKGVVRRLSPFECELLVCAPGQEAEIAAHGCASVTMEELFSQCDAVSVHLHVADGQPPVVTAALLEKMAPTSWFLNVTQANAVDERALIDAVCAERIAGAALDVFHTEPLPANYPLLGRHNVILTPGMAGKYAQKEAEVHG